MIGTQKAVGRALVMLDKKSGDREWRVQLSCSLQSPAQPAFQASLTSAQGSVEDKAAISQVQSRYAMGAC